MIGFGLGGVLMGRLADRFGIVAPVIIGSIALALGYAASSYSTSLWQYTIAQGVLVGTGSSATFGPLLAHISFWFVRRRGIAVAICASGSYVAGAVWPPVVQHFVENVGWRTTSLGIASFCLVSMLPLALLLRGRTPLGHLHRDNSAEGERTGRTGTVRPVAARAAQGQPAALQVESLGMSSGALQTLLIIAGVACCAAMAMPQVHMVAYCGDLGYGPARGAQMLSVMLACGIISRLTFGVICDRIGGLRTLLLGSCLQGLALFLFLPFDGLISLFVISALFGLFQGGIVPSYAIIVREYFPPAEAGARVGTVIMATLFGMALGGWMSGVVFDVTGSYKAAFVNGILWNLLNLSIAAWLLRRAPPRRAPALS
jgi:MFS family permease